MKLLIVKTSSLGDLVHTLPAVTDATKAYPALTIDWVVEEAFAAVPRLHPAVGRIICVGLRRWRGQMFRLETWQEVASSCAELRSTAYDYVIDAQGLCKSAVIARLAAGARYGFDFASAREPLASLAYHSSIPIARHHHAINRTRQLFAIALDYPLPDTGPVYGICDNKTLRSQAEQLALDNQHLMILHGTSRIEKEWPVSNWRDLIASIPSMRFLLPWGNERERIRATAIASGHANTTILPPLAIDELAALLTKARAVIGVDTGLLHLAAALRKPIVALFPATRPQLTGAIADGASIHPIINLCGASEICTSNVKAVLQSLLAQ